MKSQKIKHIKHYVYDNVEEFKKEKGLDTQLVENWRDGEEGDWVLADDGGVVQLLKVSKNISHPNERKNYNAAKD